MSIGNRATAATTTTNSGIAAFESFFEGWLVRQEHLLDELQSAEQHLHESREEDLRELILRVLGHYQEYYEEKSRAAHQNVFRVFSPTWFTPFERTFFWIAGFKPGLVCRIVQSSVADLTDEQTRRLNRLMVETRAEERHLAEQMAVLQEGVAAPSLVGLARKQARGGARDGERNEVDMVIEAMRSSMERVLSAADMLRTETAEKAVEFLNPAQTLKFLVAATKLQIRIRNWGLRKEVDRQVVLNNTR